MDAVLVLCGCCVDAVDAVLVLCECCMDAVLQMLNDDVCEYLSRTVDVGFSIITHTPTAHAAAIAKATKSATPFQYQRAGHTGG